MGVVSYSVFLPDLCIEYDDIDIYVDIQGKEIHAEANGVPSNILFFDLSATGMFDILKWSRSLFPDDDYLQRVEKEFR